MGILSLFRVHRSIYNGLGGTSSRTWVSQPAVSAAFHWATFYLLGLVLFVGLQLAYITIDNSKTPVGWIFLQNFVIYFAFAANVFLVFLIHFVQWFVSQLSCFQALGGSFPDFARDLDQNSRKSGKGLQNSINSNGSPV
jgi:hypothetical protein